MTIDVKQILNEEAINNAIGEVIEVMNEEKFLTETFFQIFQRVLNGFTDENIKALFIDANDLESKVRLFKKVFEIWREDTAKTLVEMAELGVQEVGGEFDEALIAADYYLFGQDYYLQSFFTVLAQMSALTDIPINAFDLEIGC